MLNVILIICSSLFTFLVTVYAYNFQKEIWAKIICILIIVAYVTLVCFTSLLFGLHA